MIHVCAYICGHARMFGLQKDELKSFTTTYHTHPPQGKREKEKKEKEKPLFAYIRKNFLWKLINIKKLENSIKNWQVHELGALLVQLPEWANPPPFRLVYIKTET